jgi:hypothetical protein
MPGTQAQKVILVAPGLQEPPATTLTLALALGLPLVAVLPGADDELPLHAASSDTAEAPAITGRMCRNRVLDNISA